MFALSRDGLLPSIFSKVHPRFKTPTRAIIITGTIMALISGFAPIAGVAEVVNIGTLAAFALVCVGAIVLRYTKPDMPRPFKTPFSPWIPLLGIIFCVYLMFQLLAFTWIVFLIWTLIGLVIYFGYGRLHSLIN
jgi:APA family basic amino acid/polyamine antiporter